MTRVVYVNVLDSGRNRVRPRARKARADARSRWHVLVPRLLLLAALVVAGLGLFTLRVGSVRVYGANLADARTLAAALEPALGERLLRLDTAALRERLASDPWVASVRFVRRPPDRLAVRLVESSPLWRLPEGGALDGWGRVLPPRPGLQLAHLPALRGWPTSSGAQAVAVARLRRFAAALENIPWGWGGGLKELRLVGAGELCLTTADGVELRLGDGDDLARLRAYVAVLDRLDPQPGDRVDLRFDRQVVLTPGAALRAAEGG